MTRKPPPSPREPLVSYATDFTFRVLQIGTTGLLLVLAITTAMDIIAKRWDLVVFEVVLLAMLAWVGVRRSFALVRSAVTLDDEGVRRRGGWDFRWGQVSAAWIERVKDVPYLVVVPRQAGAGTDLTRFFVRDKEIPRDAVVAPLDPNLAGDVREWLESRRLGRRPRTP